MQEEENKPAEEAPAEGESQAEDGEEENKPVEEAPAEGGEEAAEEKCEACGGPGPLTEKDGKKVCTTCAGAESSESSM
jgi:DnaJ-class molecular chaperone